MNKTQEELKQKTLEAIAEDIGEMLEHYDEVMEPEDTMSLPAASGGEARSVKKFIIWGVYCFALNPKAE